MSHQVVSSTSAPSDGYEDHPCGLCDTSGRCTFACEAAVEVPAPGPDKIAAARYWAMLVLSAKVLDDLAQPDPNLRKLEQIRAACARLATEIRGVVADPQNNRKDGSSL
jgi:hypothetical protein